MEENNRPRIFLPGEFSRLFKFLEKQPDLSEGKLFYYFSLANQLKDDHLHLKELAQGRNMKTYHLAKEIENWFQRSPKRNPTTIQIVFIIGDLQKQLTNLLKNFITPFKIYVDFYISVKSQMESDDKTNQTR